MIAPPNGLKIKVDAEGVNQKIVIPHLGKRVALRSAEAALWFVIGAGIS